MNCDPAEYQIAEFSYCDTTLSYDPADFCEYIDHGEFLLLRETRKHSKYMCGLMKSVTFEDGKGHELIFKKSASAGLYATQWSELCSENQDKSILHCATNEETIAMLINDSLEMEFRIMLNVDQRRDYNFNDDRDQLLITVPKRAAFGKYYSLILSYYIRQDNVYESFNSRFHFEEEFELNEKLYKDVTFFIPPENSDQMEIYYAKKLGIIAFRDKNGTLWTFKSFG
ncbi:MAG: hypothetical protein KFF73_17380 [Cyclobacteriaceae bacterium]|nr:hypothetical protein [Cyclobacteriaceae bacterium]